MAVGISLRSLDPFAFVGLFYVHWHPFTFVGILSRSLASLRVRRHPFAFVGILKRSLDLTLPRIRPLELVEATA